MPADEPSIAILSNGDVSIRLEKSVREDSGKAATPSSPHEVVITRATERMWTEGRAGMQYRDLIPGRMGGALAASHIRIPSGGPVSDYVHYHHVVFQLIYCKSGWARLVYEDQGPPFIMNTGDWVLQPPGIRHQVLETSPGFEVIEITSPAVHETWRDHEMRLPTEAFRPERIFNGQAFLHQVCSKDLWQRKRAGGFDETDMEIHDAADEQIATITLLKGSDASYTDKLLWEVKFCYVLEGKLTLEQADRTYCLSENDCFARLRGGEYSISANEPTYFLEIAFKDLSGLLSRAAEPVTQ